MRFPEYDHVVQAFPADRANEPLNVSILPGGSERNRPISNAHGAQTLHKGCPVRSVPIPNEVSRRLAPWEGLGDLARDPLRGRVFRHAKRQPNSSSYSVHTAVKIIEDAGFEVIEAGNADEAIQILERRSDVRVVFTDIHMPGSMDGLKLARAVRNRWPPIKIIVTSGRELITQRDLPEGGFLCQTLRPKSDYRHITRVAAVEYKSLPPSKGMRYCRMVRQ